MQHALASFCLSGCFSKAQLVVTAKYTKYAKQKIKFFARRTSFLVIEAEGSISLTRSGFVAGLAEQFTYFNTFQVDGHEVQNIGNQYINSSMSQVFAGYNFNNKIGVQFNLPIIYREYGYMANHGSETGIGDVSLIGNFRLYEKLTEKFTFSWTALGGVKFPTGDSAHLNPRKRTLRQGLVVTI